MIIARPALFSFAGIHIIVTREDRTRVPLLASWAASMDSRKPLKVSGSCSSPCALAHTCRHQTNLNKVLHKFRVIIYSTSQASTNPSPTMHSPLKLSTWGRRHWRCSAQQNRLWWPAASTTRAASRHPLNHMTIICRVCHKSLCLRVEMYLQQYDGVCKLRQCCDGLLERCLVHIRQHVLPCNNTPV